MAILTNQGTAGPAIDATTTGLVVERRRDGVFEVNPDATNLANGAQATSDATFSVGATDSCTLIWVGQLDQAPTILGNLITVGTAMVSLHLSTPSPGDLLLREPLTQGGRRLLAQRNQPL